jgi:DNA-binding LytR/AlgR family response regulator
MIRAVIIEDEPIAVDRLRACLALHEDIELLGNAGDGESACKLLETVRPALAFVDVRLPLFSGIEVLRRSSYKPGVIFTTAHDNYAVHAFEWGAFDYILKPFDCSRVTTALERYRARSTNLDENTELIERLQSTESEEVLVRFFVKHKGGTIPVDTESIRAIMAEGDYCRVYTPTSEHLVHVPLREFERRLDARRFKRVHRSAIVQVSQIRRIVPSGRGAVLEMGGSLQVAASRSGISSLRSMQL